MLRIPARSRAAFERQAVDAYAVALMAHARDWAPDCARALTSAELERAVRASMARAAAHGFDQRGTVRFYLEAMIVLGSGFDNDPQVAWAGRILADGTYRTPMDRAEALHARLVEHVGEVDGECGVHGRDALVRLAAWLRGAPTLDASRFDDEALALLAEIHPTKLLASGRAPIQRLIALDSAVATTGSQGEALARIALMFSFGHQFDSDPWLPWMSRDARAAERVTSEQAAEWIERVASWAGSPPRVGSAGK